MSTPALSPRPRESSHATHSCSRPAPKTRPSNSHTTPTPTVPPLTPRRMNDFKTSSHASQEAKSSSPNYFGLPVDAAAADCFGSSTAQHIRGNWSPPSSNVRSTAAASPHILPIDQNPEFEQFKRQSENNKGFTLGKLDFAEPQAPVSTSNNSFFGNAKPPLSPQSMTMPASSKEKSHDVKEGNGDIPPEKPRSPKRLLSTESSQLTEQPRRNSPASFLDNEGFGRTDEIAEFVQDRHPRPSLPSKKSTHTVTLSNHRADTLPANLADDAKTDGPTMATPQYIINILESAVEEVLLLDLRVSTQFAKSRIAGALSLCLPTTLLKRASFNVQKLAESFKEPEQKEKFERWRNSKHIIVYDANSSQLKDAAICINTLKKFGSEGWTGGSYIVRGGFEEFAKRFPAWITQGTSRSSSSSSSPSLNIDADLPEVAPVVGGCPMPATQNAANPFFGNIRQNMDLIGGVGQMSVKHPLTLTQSVEEELPTWLQKAASTKDRGKLVSEKFLHIEKREQKRMQEALSGNVVYGTPGGPAPAKNVQIAGIEKGSKNRYNNIWPYEHSRVKLENVANAGCDYVNANHVQASLTNKRYIATQGPLPATFNDFWNVVWQQDVRVIVMLTAEFEGGQLKAHNYWSDKQYGNMYLNKLGERRAALEPSKIRRHEEHLRPALGQRRSTNPPKPAHMAKETTTPSPNSEQPFVTVRKFTLSNTNEPFERMREITQLQYSNWPDFGAPAHPTHLLGLIEQCDATVRQVNGGSPSRPDPPNNRPVLVHCSAGCGRTGTFCTVDSVLDMLKRQRQGRNVRQGTPMDFDSPPRKQSQTPMDIDSPRQSQTPMDIDSSRRDSEDSTWCHNEREEGKWIGRDDIDLIEKTVEEFRLQRLSMVQSLRQFVLCYESVMEWLVEQHPKSA